MKRHIGKILLLVVPTVAIYMVQATLKRLPTREADLEFDDHIQYDAYLQDLARQPAGRGYANQ